MTFIDLFAGIGGFRRGMELAGHKCVGFCEWDEFAAASYTSMHLLDDNDRKLLKYFRKEKRREEILREKYRHGEWYESDIRNVHGDNIPRADCWGFGSPCQDFSMAGLRAGLQGNRSSLVGEVFRIIEELDEADRPEWLVYENVKGMFSSASGRDYLAIILSMEQLGFDIEWQIFNTKDFGISQNRERVYTIGHLRTRGRCKILPIQGSTGEDSVQRINFAEILGKVEEKDNTFDRNKIYVPNGVLPCLKAHDSVDPIQIGMPIEIYNDYNNYSRDNLETAVTGTLTTSAGFNQTGGFAIVYPVDMPIDTYNTYYNKIRESEVGTITTKSTAFRMSGSFAILCPLGISRNVRSDYGKAIRKEYEAGKLDISRHEFLEMDIRTDGVTNTLDSVQKDNYLVCKVDLYPDELEETHPMLKLEFENGASIYARWYPKYNTYIVSRLLTPRECFKLQGWSDEYYDKALWVNSPSQLYKQAGNGISVNVSYEIGRKLKSQKERAEDYNNEM